MSKRHRQTAQRVILTPTRKSVGFSQIWWLFVAAALFKVIYFIQSQQSPFFEPRLLDAKYYQDWAVRLAQNIPDSTVFYGLPLYPYFLAALYKLFGISFTIAKVAQALLGLVTVFFIGKISEKLFDFKAALASMALAVCYGPLTFHENMLIPEALGLPLYAIALYGALRLLDRPSMRMAIAVGVVFGLAALTKAGILLFIPFYLFYFLKKSFSAEKTKQLILCAAACFLTLAPVTAHNVIRGKDWVWLTSHAGFNFYVGNHPGAEGVFSAPEGTGTNVDAQIEDSRSIAESALGRKLKPSEVSRYWSGKAWEFIRSSPGEFIQLSLKKLILFFDSREVSDVEDYQFAKIFTPLLRFPWPNFTVLGPLFFLGLALGWKTLKHRTMYLAWILAYLLGMIAFFVNARYRLPLLPALFPVAGQGLVLAVGAGKEKKWGTLTLGGVALIFGILVSQAHLVGTQFVSNYVNAGDGFAETGELDKAKRFYDKALQVDPHYPKANLAMGVLLSRQQRFDEAKTFYEKTIQEDPKNSQAWNNLGMWYERSGDMDEAQRHFLKAIECKPGSSQGHNNLGMVYGKRGDLDRAREQFELSLAINPQSARTMTNLGLIAYRTGDRNGAKTLWQKALAIDPNFTEAQKALSLVDSFDSHS